MVKRLDKELSEPGLYDADGNTGSPTPIMDTSSLGSAPTPKEAEKIVKKEEKKEEKQVERVLPSIPLRVFQSVSGVKPHKFQAFMRYALKEQMRPCSVTEWKIRYQEFLNKPTKPMR